MRTPMKFILAIIALFILINCAPESTPPQEKVHSRISYFQRYLGSPIGDLTITNNTNNYVKDIKVKCNGFSKTNTHIDSTEHMIYEVVPSKETINITMFHIGHLDKNVETVKCITTAFTKI
jgi:hypothetical protein